MVISLLKEPIIFQYSEQSESKYADLFFLPLLTVRMFWTLKIIFMGCWFPICYALECLTYKVPGTVHGKNYNNFLVCLLNRISLDDYAKALLTNGEAFWCSCGTLLTSQQNLATNDNCHWFFSKIMLWWLYIYNSNNNFTERFCDMNNMEIQREAVIEIVGTQYEERALNHRSLFLQQELVLKHQSDNPHDHNAVILLTKD